MSGKVEELGGASREDARPQPGANGSENLHTPGPWEYGEHPAIPSMGSVRPALSPRNVHVLGPCEGSMVLLRNKADARLIAAAPDLLDALKQALAEWPGTASDSTRGFMAAAIRKAEGRS